MNKWTKFFLRHAVEYATLSKDPSTKVAATITQGNKQISQGFNGFPAGINDDPALLKERKVRLACTLHAELNAILHCDSSKLPGSTIHITAPPCSQCAAVIVQVNITEVIYLEGTKEFMERWGWDVEIALDLFKQKEIAVIKYPKIDIYSG